MSCWGQREKTDVWAALGGHMGQRRGYFGRLDTETVAKKDERGRLGLKTEQENQAEKEEKDVGKKQRLREKKEESWVGIFGSERGDF